MKRPFKYFTSLIVLFLFQGQLLSQDTDSLKLALKSAATDSLRLSILNVLFGSEPDMNVWATYNDQIIKIAERNTANLKTSLDTLFLRNLAAGISNKGYVLSVQGKTLESLELFERSLHLDEKLKDENGVATALVNIGSIFDVQGNTPKALDCFHKALATFEKLKDKEGMSYCFINIGNIHKRTRDYSTAMNYYKKSLEANSEVKNQKGIANSLNFIGAVCQEEGNNKTALEYFKKSLAIREKIQDANGIAQSLNNIGTVYRNTKDYKNAKDYFKQSLQIFEKIKDKKGLANTYDNMAQTYLVNGEINDAAIHARLSFEIAKQTESPKILRNSARTMKLIFQKQNKYKEAFEMYELEIKMKDSLNSEDAQKATIKKQMQYTYEKKELELKAEQDKKDIIAKEELKQKEKERNYFIAGFALVLLLALFVLRGYRQKQKANAIIVAQKQLVDAKQKEILDSIYYAKRIQTTLLPSEKYIEKKLDVLKSGKS